VQKKRRLEPFGYQPNNPLTIYYKKYIEEVKDESKEVPSISKKKKKTKSKKKEIGRSRGY